MSRVKWKTIANVPGLLKDEVSGRYYARFWRNSKPVWISLKTDVPTVTKARIARERKAFKSSKRAEATIESGEATSEQISRVYLDEVKNKVDIKGGTRFYYGRIVKAILESWPELKGTKPKDISESDCQAWAKWFSERYSANRYNVAVDRLRDIFQVAVDRGIIYRNPAAELDKRTPKRKHLDLPSLSEFRCCDRIGPLGRRLAFESVRGSDRASRLLGVPNR